MLIERERALLFLLFYLIPNLIHNLQHFFVNLAVGGKNLFARVEVVAAAEISYSAACLHQDKCAGCNVPRTEQALHARFSSAAM